MSRARSRGLWLFCSLLLLSSFINAGCGKRSEEGTAAALPQGTQGINTGDCSSILQNVVAGGDISISIKCDQPTESKIIDALSKDDWTSGCPIETPIRHFRLVIDRASATSVALPSPGNYFSQFDFQLKKTSRYLSELEFIAMHGADIYGYEQASQEMADMSRARYNTAARIGELVGGGGRVPYESEMLLAQEDWPDDEQGLVSAIRQRHARITSQRLGEFTARRLLHMEDGKGFAAERIGIYQDTEHSDAYQASIAVLDFLNPYPRWNRDHDGRDDDAMVYIGYTCTASKGIGLQTFGKLCSALLERQLLSSSDTIGNMAACRKPEADEEE